MGNPPLSLTVKSSRISLSPAVAMKKLGAYGTVDGVTGPTSVHALFPAALNALTVTV